MGDGAGLVTMTTVVRTIESLRRESEHAVVLRLGCGHTRHVRHNPPLSDHPWVVDQAASAEKVGQAIECGACVQRRLPAEAAFVRKTADFSESTVPRGLRADHRTRAGTWARVVVESGVLHIEFEAPLHERAEGRPGQPVSIPPELPHRVELDGPVVFAVEFLRVAAD